MVLDPGQLTIQTLTDDQWFSLTEEEWDQLLLCVPSINDPSSSFKGRAFGRTHSRVFGSRFDIASDELDPLPPAEGVSAVTGPLDEGEFSNAVTFHSIRHPGDDQEIGVDAMDVRRDSDNAILTIKYVSDGSGGGILDYAAIETHCGTANGFVTKIYNRGSGGATYDVSQATTTKQPLICIHGEAIEAPLYDGTDDFLFVDATPVTAAGFSMFAWATSEQQTLDIAILWVGDKDVTSDEWFLMWDGGTPAKPGFLARDGGASKANGTANPILFGINAFAGIEAASNDRRSYLNGTGKGTNATLRTPDNADRMSIGAAAGSTVDAHHAGMIHETVIMTDVKDDADVASQHTFGRPNASTAFMIEAVSAAADAVHGVSVRKLRDLYGGPLMTVRESGGDTLQDFYPKPLDGSMPGTAMENFCGAANGLVTTLHDQIGTLNLVNATETEQPEIVNGGTVSTKGPLFDDAASQHLQATTAAVTAFPFSHHCWAASDDDTQTGVMCGIGSSSSTTNHKLALFESDNEAAAFSGGSRANSSNTYTEGVVDSVFGQWVAGPSDEDRSVVFSGLWSGRGVDGDAGSMTGVNITIIGAGRWNGGLLNPFSGHVPEMLTFPSTKTQAEVESLDAFGSPVAA